MSYRKEYQNFGKDIKGKVKQLKSGYKGYYSKNLSIRVIRRCAKRNNATYPKIAKLFGIQRELTSYEKQQISSNCKLTLQKRQELLEKLFYNIKGQLKDSESKQNKNFTSSMDQKRPNFILEFFSCLFYGLLALIKGLIRGQNNREIDIKVLEHKFTSSLDELDETADYPYTYEDTSNLEHEFFFEDTKHIHCYHCGDTSHTHECCLACFSDDGELRRPMSLSSLLAKYYCKRCMKVFGIALYHPFWLCPWRPEALHLYDSGFIVPTGIFGKKWDFMQKEKLKSKRT